MKECLTNALLAAVEHTAINTVNLVWALSTSKYESHRRLQSLILNNSGQTVGDKTIRKLKVDLKEYRKYYALLSRLNKQGLISSKGSGHQKEWSITSLGMKKLVSSKNNFRDVKIVDEIGLTIISYDIPERMRQVRGQLRDLLKIAGFKQIHQSLWYSNKKVTRVFLEILKELKVVSYVHIFEISKSGSLDQVYKQ